MVYIEPTPYILGLIRELVKLGTADIHVIFIQENITQNWNLSLTGYRAEVLPKGLVQGVKTLQNNISRGNYQILHLAGWGHKLLLVALFSALLQKIPVVMESDTQLPFEQALWKRAVKAVLYPLLFRLPSLLLPGGTRQKAYFRHYGVSDDHIRVVNMTVDVTYILKRCSELGETGRKQIRIRLGLQPNHTVFIFVGRLVPHKGIKELLSAFERISSTYKGARLLIVGDGPERDTVRIAAERNSNIIPMGRLNQNTIIEMYHASDIAVLPSLFEPWGLVVNEAMAAGLPVIASENVGCVDDLIMPGRTGLFVPAEDSVALADAMKRMIDDDRMRRYMSNQARELISGWTLENESRRIAAAWSSAVGIIQ